MNLNGFVSQGRGHLLPLTFGEELHPQSKQGGITLQVSWVAWHGIRKQHYVCMSKEILGAAKTGCITHSCLRTRCFNYGPNTWLLKQIQAKQKQTENQTSELRQSDHANHIYSPDCIFHFFYGCGEALRKASLDSSAPRINMHSIKYKRHQ